MNDLFDMLKLLALVWLILIAMLGLPFVLVKIALVCSSDSGLWTEYPHSGFCPEAPEAPLFLNGQSSMVNGQSM